MNLGPSAAAGIDLAGIGKKAEKFAAEASGRGGNEDIFSIMGSERRSVANLEEQIRARIQLKEGGGSAS